MHEMGLAEGILAVALEAAAGEKVRRITLVVGNRQMVMRESLEFSFRLAAEGTPAAEAGLAVEEIPTRLHCNHCGAETEANFPPWNCRQCGGAEVEILAGDELLVDAVELESGHIIRRGDTN
ncbi:MAG: hydrogenase maturation nickel metallochaperone HypA [Candidatus Binatia bacterium]